MIKLIHLSKQYGNHTAINDVQLTVNAGEIFGFIGPNGAGKTTTIQIMAGLLVPTSGNVMFF
jgi:ABC-type multidrug transport system, ATPase component